MHDTPPTSSAAAPAASSSGRPGPASPASASPGCSPTTASSHAGRGRTTATQVRQPAGPEEAACSRPRRRAVIFLFMYGGPSQVDTFDYKPEARTRSTARRSRSRRSAAAGRRTRAASSGRSGSSSSTASAASGSATCSRTSATCVDDIAFLHSHERRVADPRLGHADDEHAAGSSAAARASGSWVELRPGQREREPARLRRHARPDRRADQRAEELVERLHAGRVPGRTILRSTGTPILDLAPAAGHDRASSSATCSTACSENNEEHLRRRGRQQRTRRPHRQLRAGVQDAAARPGGGRLLDRRPTETQGPLRHRRRPRPTTSAASACSPGGWSSAACGSSRSTPAAPTTTTTGTPTATW